MLKLTMLAICFTTASRHTFTTESSRSFLKNERDVTKTTVRNNEKLLQKLQAIPVRLSTCTHALWVCVTRIYNELEVQDVSGTLSLKHAQNLCNARSRCGALLRLSWIPGFFGALNSCKPTVGGCLCYQAFHRKSGCCMPSASWHATEAADSWTSTHCS